MPDGLKYCAMSTRIHSIQTEMSCAYLIEGEEGLVLVDAGGPGTERVILRKIRALGHAQLRLIYLTHAHFDHYGGAAALHRATGAPVAIHRADAQALAGGLTQIGSARGIGKVMAGALPLLMRLLKPTGHSAQVLLEDGDELGAYGLDAIVVHTPGHTPGSSSLLLHPNNPEVRIAFVGDLITAARSVHVQRLFAQDWEQVQESLGRIRALQPQRVYGGHGCRAIMGEELQRLWSGE
jgi:glyoxylase-like metal-dependent hydrolase (beta-lactamase superfamily II)